MDTNNIEEHRKQKRVKFSEAVNLQFTDPQRDSGTLSCDLSEGGLCINLNDFVPPNTELNVQVNLGPQKVIEHLGRIAWVNKLPHSDRYQAGVEFVEDDDLLEFRKEIQGFVEQD